MNTFKIDSSTIRTHSSEFLAASQPKTHWHSLSSVLWTNIRYISWYCSHCHQIGLCNKLKFAMLNGYFLALILGSKHHISTSKLITNLNGVFISYPAKIVIRILISTKTLFYWANAYENAWLLPQCLNRKSLEFLHTVTILCPCKRGRSDWFKTKQKLTAKFWTFFTTKDIDFIHF